MSDEQTNTKKKIFTAGGKVNYSVTRYSVYVLTASVNSQLI